MRSLVFAEMQLILPMRSLTFADVQLGFCLAFAKIA